MNARITAVLIVGLFIGSIFLTLGTDDSSSYEVTEFGNSGNPIERIISLEGRPGEGIEGGGAPYKDATTVLNLPIGKNVILPDSYVEVSVVDDGTGKYATRPSVDVGMDGDLEWAYQGEGYGEFGHQDVFSDDTSKRTLKYLSAGSNTNLKVKVPKEAQVTGAYFDIEGRLSSPTFTGYKLDIDRGLVNIKYIDTGDINGDGADDIIATSSNTDNSIPDLVWYENPSPPSNTEWKKHYITNTSNNAWAPKVVDMDSDGDYDIVMSTDSSSGGIWWFENKDYSVAGDGDGGQWEGGDTAHRIDNSNKVNYARNFDVGDIDNDGDLDVAVASYEWAGMNIYWFENTAPSSSTSWTRHTARTDSSSGQISDLVLAQINTTTSTRLDIICANWQAPNHDVFWLENDGSPKTGTWDYHRINPLSGTYAYPTYIDAGDIDGDGNTDVVAAHGYTRGIWWYKCPSDPSNQTSAWSDDRISSTIYYPSDIKLGQVNNDGDVDVITTTSTSIYGYEIYYCEQPDTIATDPWTVTMPESDLSGIAGIAIADLDGSGNDIIAGGTSVGELFWYKNNGGATPTWNKRPVDEAGINRPQGLYVADIDGDGDKDFITTGVGGSEVLWYENPADPYDMSAWTSHSIRTGVTNPWDVAVGYFSNDNYPDVAVTLRNYGSSGGAVVWFQHPGAGVKSATSWTMRTVASNRNYPSGIAAGDVDDDGDDDIIFSEEYGYSINYCDNANGQGTSWTRNVLATNLRYYPTGVSLGDLNNDGILDAVVGCRYYSPWSTSTSVEGFYAPATPASASWTQFSVDKDLYTVYDTFIEDIDHDGYNDVIATTSGDGINWYRNPTDGIGDWKEYVIYSDSNFGSQFIWVGDIGYDGYWDIIASSDNKNRVYWFEQPDEPEKGYSWETYTVGTIANARGVFVEEVDGDGQLDIISVGYGSSEIWWFSANMVYPHDIKLNVGGRGDWDYTYTGTVKAAKSTTDLSFQFNEILTDVATSWETDIYGNNLTEIYLNIYSPDPSRVLIHTINISYSYDAKIQLNPHNKFLYNELNEIIPDEGSGNYSVNICVQSYSPAKIKLSSVFIRYNSPPFLEKKIESTFHVLEGTSNSHLIDLYKYFSDDYDEVEDLIYRVEYNSNPDKIWALISNSRYVKVSATKDDDWYGTFELSVSATDTLGLKRVSNTFIITVDNDDDPPDIGSLLPNFEIPEGTRTYLMDMNNSNYFIDGDSSELFYRGVVDDTYRQYLKIEFDEDKKMYAEAFGDWYESNVPVQIYCDDQDLSDKSYDDLENMEVFQDIVIDVINVNDPPQWVNFPKSISIEEDYTTTHGMDFRWMNLNQYVDDIDNNEFDLSYSVFKNTNSSFIRVSIDRQDYVHIDNSLVDNHNGQTDVTIRVSDGQLYSDITFSIKIIPVNDKPTISILSPADKSTVSGNAVILGNAYDLEGLDKVMVQIDDGPWKKVTGTTNWKFTWNTLNYDDGEYTLTFKAFDNDAEDPKISNSAVITLKVYNALSDPDGDGYFGDNDAFPYEPTQWSDVDEDGAGDNPDGYNPDAFPEDPLEWLDSDGDGFGNRYDDFPYDKTQWNDTDGDGFGDNGWGNNPDTNINNPNVPGKLLEQAAEQDSGKDSDKTVTYLWYMVVIIGIIIGIVSGLYSALYKPKPEE